ncbi:hypothetical protein FKW77_005944 [Venturia effusa]|uniref:Major facilitator superfamily (MFS) profile domain-containing protein n=1 Tax=Venturia effusa TaxID=50376 RepID=A0A517LCE1_9PEZI|nr:hypothetical protein FKW77_005944 [Venturia effusa]
MHDASARLNIHYLGNIQPQDLQGLQETKVRFSLAIFSNLNSHQFPHHVNSYGDPLDPAQRSAKNWPICITGLVAGSFAANLGGLIVTQGVVYGIGFLIFYYPILSFVNEFWVERRGMAYGLLCSASGVSGIGMPFIITKLLERYGYPTTLRATAVALAILTGPLIPYLKGRLPVSNSTAIAATDWTFLKLPLFWIYSLSNLIYGL